MHGDNLGEGAPDRRSFRETALGRTIYALRAAFASILVLSFATNILLFVAPLYMLQIYDRVISTRNHATLLMLTLVASALLIIYAILESLRSRILVRVGIAFDDRIASLVFNATHNRLSTPTESNTQVVQDVDVLREFISGPTLLAVCDAPWFPIFVAATFILHPLYGWVALGGSLLIISLTLLNGYATRNDLAAAASARIEALQRADSTIFAREVILAMGMLDAIGLMWCHHHGEHLRRQAKASDRAAILIAAARGVRLLLQIAILGTGGLLAISNEASAGSIVAASVLAARALQPIEILVTYWKNLVAGHASFYRIKDVLAANAVGGTRHVPPSLQGAINADAVAIAAPAGGPPIVSDITFGLRAGELLAIIGSSGAGKTTLLRAIAGIWPVVGGRLSVDGYEIRHWPQSMLGRQIGYLPQTIDLIPGSVSENIARFQETSSDLVVEAARAAQCHHIIQMLPEGYNTQIGEGGYRLSGGQRQRIGLARALYGSPRLVLLDEPTAHLDEEGQRQFAAVIVHLRASRSTVLVVSHAAWILKMVDHVLLLRDGRVAAFGRSVDLLAPKGSEPCQTDA